MKLRTLISETSGKRIKLLITENQLKNLASMIIHEHERGKIKNANLTKQNSNDKR